MAVREVERFCEGDWIPVPSVQVGPSLSAPTGRRLRVAAVDAEDCCEAEVSDPETCILSLVFQRVQGLDVEGFTVVQKLLRSESAKRGVPALGTRDRLIRSPRVPENLCGVSRRMV